MVLGADGRVGQRVAVLVVMGGKQDTRTVMIPHQHMVEAIVVGLDRLLSKRVGLEVALVSNLNL